MRSRVSRVRPRPGDGEPAEDVAVFDAARLKSLSPEIAQQVTAVRDALEAVAAGRDERARQCLQSIPRRSLLSDWRLFITGLIDWYHDAPEKAEQSWRRLDAQRRPARIAANLRQSQQLHRSGGDAKAAAPDVRMIWRLRFERPALAEAYRETADAGPIPESISEDDWIGPAQVDWLRVFATEQRRFEPHLVQSLCENALIRIYHLPFSDGFEHITKRLPGPVHDPQNLWLKFLFYAPTPDHENQAEPAALKYLQSLDQNDQLSANVRDAVKCQVYLALANHRRASLNPLARILHNEGPEDRSEVNRYYQAACKAYPASSEPHREYVGWLQEYADPERFRKADRQWYESRLATAMEAWSKGVPEEITPRLWLVDHYFDKEMNELAVPHVKWLAASRHPNPKVRAIEWKWNLLESMRLARRKTRVAQAQEHFDNAKSLWPEWVCQEWVPYLQAALSRRAGDLPSFEAQRKEAREQLGGTSREDLADAVMALGAMQMMRLPAAELKAFRGPVDQAAKSVSTLPTEQLLACGRFFRDLHRTNSLYPAYRMHGAKFANELKKRITNTRNLFSRYRKQDCWAAVEWLVHKKTFYTNYQFRLPPVIMSKASQAQVIFWHFQTLLNTSTNPRLVDLEQRVQILKQAASEESDPYLRHAYAETAERALHELRPEPLFGEFAEMFFNAFADDDDDDDDDVF
ncbi:hypothetical protein [Roseimaritima sediminicola]|uniref:hypothetical protein n=1 Tax=Roseimaritima sediminicola TaxID=2662066 RepID=UPI00129829E4|nr:hypothetical protein [Roseimaritima sediminicola]